MGIRPRRSANRCAVDMSVCAPIWAHMRPRPAAAAPTMIRDTRATLEACNCLALRQAARHVTQFYDQVLAPAGLRTTPFSIIGKLHVTDAGAARLRAAAKHWAQAQTRFEAVFGGKRTAELRTILHAVATSDFGTVRSGAQE